MISLLLVFAAILCLTIAVFLLLDNKMRSADIDSIKSRLVGGAKPKKSRRSPNSPALINNDEIQGMPLAIRLLSGLKVRERIQNLLERAGLKWNLARFVRNSLVCMLSGFTLFWYLLPPPFNRCALAVAPVALFMPAGYAFRKARVRMRKFEEQFPESLEFVARSMRAGHAFSVSLEMLHREFEEPLAGEFRRTFDEQNLGLPLDVALEKLAKRIPLLDVQFFVSAVLLQKRTGGNLAELLDKLAFLIRERFKLRGRIRAISAHGRMTGTVLSLIPAAVGVMMFYVNPDYAMFFFTDPTGQIMMIGALVMQGIGYGIIKKIVSIEV